MKTQAAIDHFGSVRALADALEITVQSVYEWGEIPPRGRQFEIQALTSGALLAEPRQASADNAA